MGLFVHSVRLVLADWRNALKITGVLYLICAVPGLILLLMFPASTEPGQLAAAAGPTIIWGLLYLVAFLWMAVAWHRYILLDEYPAGPLPEFNGRRMLSYFGYSMLMFGIGLVAWLIIGVLIGTVAVLTPGLTAFVAIITGLVGLAGMLIVTYRLAPLLPAAAIGKPLAIGQAWASTSGATGTIIVLAIVSAICAIVIDIPGVILGMGGPAGGLLALVWQLITGWVKLMVGISILTTLYGHYVEGRAIPAN